MLNGLLMCSISNIPNARVMTLFFCFEKFDCFETTNARTVSISNICTKLTYKWKCFSFFCCCCPNHPILYNHPICIAWCCTILLCNTLHANDHHQHLIGAKINRKNSKVRKCTRNPMHPLNMNVYVVFMCAQNIDEQWAWQQHENDIRMLSHCGKRRFHRLLCGVQCELFVSHLCFAPSPKETSLIYWFSLLNQNIQLHFRISDIFLVFNWEAKEW